MYIPPPDPPPAPSPSEVSGAVSPLDDIIPLWYNLKVSIYIKPPPVPAVAPKYDPPPEPSK